MGGIGGGLVAKFGDDPGVTARELDGGWAAVLAWARGARGRVLAGGEAGEEGGEAAQGAAEAVVEGHEEDAEEGGAGVDEVAQGGDDLIDTECESDGWVRGGCAVLGAVGVHVHDTFYITAGGPVQRCCGAAGQEFGRAANTGRSSPCGGASALFRFVFLSLRRSRCLAGRCGCFWGSPRRRLGWTMCTGPWRGWILPMA